MALKVWLPLTGTLENKGISDVEIIGNRVTLNNNGKLGQCYNFNNSNIVLKNINLSNISSLSVACWIKDSNTSSTQAIINCRTAVGNGLAVFLIGGKIRLDIGNTNCTFDWVYNLSNWTHICCTAEGNVRKLYVNGTLQQEKTVVATYTTFGTIASIGMSSVNTASPSGNILYADLNDFRLYTHCLSAKEVKEISQGLILHYKLDNNNITNFTEAGNLIPNSKNMALGSANVSTGTWRVAGTNNMTRTRVQINDSPVGTCYCFQNVGIQTANDGSCYGIDNTTYFEPNTEYRISMFARITAGTEGYAGYNIYNISEELGGSHTKIDKNYRVTPLNSDGTWTYCWYHIKTNSSTTRNIYIGITTGETSVTTQMCLVRIDKWNDGMSNNIIKDSSGYENNGVITNIPLIQNDTPRYQNSMKLSKKKINCSSCFMTTEDPIFTISFWFKLYSNITYTSYADLLSLSTNSYSSQPFRLEICGSPAGKNIMWFRGPSGNSGGFTVSSTSSGWYALDQWHHTALVSAGNKQYICYFDGVQTNTFNGSSYSWTPTGNLSIGDSGEGTASFSDFRIYATALSAEDIAELYHTPANIDNLGNIHGFEMIEDGDKQNVNEKGQIVNNGSTKTYLVNNFSETNSMTGWSFGGSPTISNGVVTMSGINPAFNSSNFTVNPDDIIVVEFDIQMPTISTTTSGPGVFIGTPTGSANSTTRFQYNFTTQTWAVANSNDTNPYFMYSYNSTDYYHCRTYLLGSNKTIDDLPPAEATNTRTLYALKLNSATTAKIRSGYNSNTTMTIKLSNFKIYKLDNEGFCETGDIAKIGEGYYQATQFIEK